MISYGSWLSQSKVKKSKDVCREHHVSRALFVRLLRALKKKPPRFTKKRNPG